MSKPYPEWWSNYIISARSMMNDYTAKDLIRQVERSKPRFGQCVKVWPNVAELRRQKKAPHKEVLYVWLDVTLRSVNNCTNEQLTEAIRGVGSALENRIILQADAEYLLDALYLELGTRANA